MCIHPILTVLHHPNWKDGSKVKQPVTNDKNGTDHSNSLHVYLLSINSWWLHSYFLAAGFLPKNDASPFFSGAAAAFFGAAAAFFPT